MTRYQFLKAISEHVEHADLMGYIDENGERNNEPGFLLVDTIVGVASSTWESLGRHHDEQDLFEEFAASMDELSRDLSNVGDGVIGIGALH